MIASILFNAYKHGIYFLLPSITSIISSSVASHFKQISALFILYYFRIAFIVSSDTFVPYAIRDTIIPPLSLRLKSISAGLPFSLIPKP